MNAPFLCIEPWFGYSVLLRVEILWKREASNNRPKQTFEGQAEIQYCRKSINKTKKVVHKLPH
jgi:hypothetical protein